MRLPLTLSVLALASCRTPYEVPVEVVTEPPGARVICNGEFMGEAPVTFNATVIYDGEAFRWLKTKLVLEAIPSRAMMEEAGTSGSVQKRTVYLDGDNRDGFKTFFDMGLEAVPDVTADINIGSN